MCLVDLIQREGIGDQIRYRNSDFLCSPQEVKGGCIISKRVDPGSDQVDLLGAEIKVRINRCVPVVDEEAQLAETAAIADEMVNIGMGYRGTCALERKIRQMSVKGIGNCLCQIVNSLVLHEVYGVCRAEFL